MLRLALHLFWIFWTERVVGDDGGEEATRCASVDLGLCLGWGLLEPRWPWTLEVEVEVDGR